MLDDTAAFRVAAITGVTLTKWTRAWSSRRPEIPLEVIRTGVDDQVSVLHDGGATVSFVRLPIADAGLSVIPLYIESPVVVVPKDHPIAAFDSVALADLVDENQLAGAWDDAIELVAANVGVVVVPQSIARLHGRKDVVAVAVTDAPQTRIALAWLKAGTTDQIEEFAGIVRGRSADSSRAASAPSAPRKASEKTAAKTAARLAAGGKGGATQNSTAGGAKVTRAPQSQAAARDAANRRKRGGNR